MGDSKQPWRIMTSSLQPGLEAVGERLNIVQEERSIRWQRRLFGAVAGLHRSGLKPPQRRHRHWATDKSLALLALHLPSVRMAGPRAPGVIDGNAAVTRGCGRGKRRAGDRR